MRHKKRRFRATNRQAVMFTLIACMLVGVVIGAIAGVGAGYTAVSGSLTGYLQGFRDAAPEPMDILRESALKYGKIFVFIWLLAFLPSGGFLPVGGLAATMLIIFRGASYGFSTAALIRSYGMAGAVCAAMLYLPQSLLLIPAYIFAAYSCIWFIQMANGGSPAFTKTGARRGGFLDFTQKTGELKEYLPVLAIGLIISLLAGLIDAFVVPGLVRGLLG